MDPQHRPKGQGNPRTRKIAAFFGCHFAGIIKDWFVFVTIAIVKDLSVSRKHKDITASRFDVTD